MAKHQRRQGLKPKRVTRPKPKTSSDEIINVQNLPAPMFIDMRTFDRLWLIGYDTPDNRWDTIPDTIKVYRYQVCMSGCNKCRVQHSTKSKECWRSQNPYQTDIPYQPGYAHFYSQECVTPYLQVFNHNYKCIMTKPTKSKVKISTFQLINNQMILQ